MIIPPRHPHPRHTVVIQQHKIINMNNIFSLLTGAAVSGLLTKKFTSETYTVAIENYRQSKGDLDTFKKLYNTSELTAEQLEIFQSLSQLQPAAAAAASPSQSTIPTYKDVEEDDDLEHVVFVNQIFDLNIKKIDTWWEENNKNFKTFEEFLNKYILLKIQQKIHPPVVPATQESQLKITLTDLEKNNPKAQFNLLFTLALLI